MNAIRLVLFFCWLPLTSMAQHAFRGKVFDEQQKELPGAVIRLIGSDIYSGTTNSDGLFELAQVAPGNYQLEVFYLGYRKFTEEVSVTHSSQAYDVELKEDVLGLEDVVISGNRNRVNISESPVLVSRIDNRIFESSQAASLAEGLNFSPGLRLENNCQNCGFTQLRMNGLDGSYTQILINGRPVFSSLTSVYGLEMIPANMIERVEVVRGGGSSLYGGNAIAGTVNVITKSPEQNQASFSNTFSLIGGSSPENTFISHASLVSPSGNGGVSIYGNRRDRQPWDANGDTFSEITFLENQTFGIDAFWKPDERQQVKVNIFSIQEHRRGGNDFGLPPHQADIAEDLQHQIFSGSATFEFFSEDYRHKWSGYQSGQLTLRDSYYGTGGRLIPAGEPLLESDRVAMNAYGNSQDITSITGFMYNFTLKDNVLFTSGIEYNYNMVEDAMPGYRRQIDQEVSTVGIYSQIEIDPWERLRLVLGGRWDQLWINGRYTFEQDLNVQENYLSNFNPRLSFLFEKSKSLKLRLSYAQGFRAPQAFNEDLHIETVGGAARFIQLGENLKPEKSESVTGSVNFTRIAGPFEFNLITEGFFTYLRNPFLNTNPVETATGVSVITKRNGSGQRVYGTNIEVNAAYGPNFIATAGITGQQAEFIEPEVIWEPESAEAARQEVTTSRMTRTPDWYGYLSLRGSPIKNLWMDLNQIYTGSMLVPHMIDPATEYTVLEETMSFLQVDFRVSYQLGEFNHVKVDAFSGVKNIFNSYQSDFDRGIDRDAGYIYGPNIPRTLYLGFQIGI